MGKKKSDSERGQGGFEGLLGGLTDFLEKLGELAEKGEQLSKSGEFHWKGGEKDLKGLYGVSLKVGIGGEGVKVEPFGNIRRDEKSGQAVVHEIREPVVDIFEEEDHTLVVAEMPGIAAEDVTLTVKDDLLTIQARRGEKTYRKEILLPRAYPREKMALSCNNGMVEIKCTL